MSCAGPLIRGLVGIKYVTCTLGRGRLVLPCLGKPFANDPLDKLKRKQKKVRRTHFLLKTFKAARPSVFVQVPNLFECKYH